jgi:hypothetical protein
VAQLEYQTTQDQLASPVQHLVLPLLGAVVVVAVVQQVRPPAVQVVAAAQQASVQNLVLQEPLARALQVALALVPHHLQAVVAVVQLHLVKVR